MYACLRARIGVWMVGGGVRVWISPELEWKFKLVSWLGNGQRFLIPNFYKLIVWCNFLWQIDCEIFFFVLPNIFIHYRKLIKTNGPISCNHSMLWAKSLINYSRFPQSPPVWNGCLFDLYPPLGQFSLKLLGLERIKYSEWRDLLAQKLTCVFN